MPPRTVAEPKMGPVKNRLGQHAVKRILGVAQAEKVLLDSYLTAPLAAAPSRGLVRNTVKGWVDNPIGYHLMKFLKVE